MNSHVTDAIDARQTPQWGIYLESIGWKVKRIGHTQLFIRILPIFNTSIIKIQHPTGPLPFKEIDLFAVKNGVMFVVIEPHSHHFSENDFIKNGYEKSKVFFAHTATSKINLQPTKTKLFKSFSENARRNINKARTENLEIRTIYMKDKNNWSYFDIFYSLLTNLGKMKNFYVPTREEYYKKMTAFQNSSILLFAYHNKIPIAVVWYAHFKNVMAYFQTGITKKGYETLANYLLVWEGLLLGKKLGLTVFDFESIFDPRFPKNVPKTKKYTEFKKRFHGTIIEYPHPWIKTYSWAGKILYKTSTLF